MCAIKNVIFVIGFLAMTAFNSCEKHDDHKLDTCGDGEISAADAVWSHGEGDLQNTKRASGIRVKGCVTGPTTTPVIDWGFDLGGPGSAAAPVIGDDGTIYIVGEYPGEPLGDGWRNSGLMTINPSGTMKWFFPLPKFVFLGAVAYYYSESVALATDGTIYFGAWDSTLYALNPDGTTKWKHEGVPNRLVNGWPSLASPVIDQHGNIYTGTDTVFCFRPDGSIKWKFIADTLQYCTQITPGRYGIYCGFMEEGIVALDYEGNTKWSYPIFFFDYDGKYGILLDEHENLYFRRDGSHIMSLTGKGTLRWDQPYGGTTPVLHGNYLYFGNLSSIFRINTSDGDSTKQIASFPRYISADESSLLVDDNGTIYYASRYTGCCHDENVPYNAPLLAAVSSDGIKLWEIGLSSGVGSSFEAPWGLSRSGVLYIASFDEADIPTAMYRLYSIH